MIDSVIYIEYLIYEYYLLATQATISAPVKGKMMKGLCMCYLVVIMTFFTVAITGYWAFGKKANGLIFTNFLNAETKHYFVPTWFIFLVNLFTVLQLSAVAVVNTIFF